MWRSAHRDRHATPPTAWPSPDRRHSSIGQRGQRIPDCRERQSGALRHLDDGDTAQHRSRIAALVAAIPRTRNQSLRFVEMERGDGDAAAFGDFADAQLPCNCREFVLLHRCLTSTMLEVLGCPHRRRKHRNAVHATGRKSEMESCQKRTIRIEPKRRTARRGRSCSSTVSRPSRASSTNWSLCWRRRAIALRIVCRASMVAGSIAISMVAPRCSSASSRRRTITEAGLRQRCLPSITPGFRPHRRHGAIPDRGEQRAARARNRVRYMRMLRFPAARYQPLRPSPRSVGKPMPVASKPPSTHSICPVM